MYDFVLLIQVEDLKLGVVEGTKEILPYTDDGFFDAVTA